MPGGQQSMRATEATAAPRAGIGCTQPRAALIRWSPMQVTGHHHVAAMGSGLLAPLRQPSQSALSPFSPHVFDLDMDVSAAKPSSRAALDRCFSERHLGADEPGSDASGLHQILRLFAASSPFQAQVRAAMQLAGHASAPAAPPGSPLPAHPATAPGLGGLPIAQAPPTPPASSQPPPAHPPPAAAAALQLAHQVHALRCRHAGSDGSVDVDAIARELLALGYMVQLRDDAHATDTRAKDPRSCLQTLRHRFIVCIGLNPRMAPHPLPHPCAQQGGEAAAQVVVAGAAADPVYLQRPLIVEPCLREQFLIAHPSPAYEALLQVSSRPAGLAGGRGCAARVGGSGLSWGATAPGFADPHRACACPAQAVPPCFVGTMSALEVLVKLLCDEMGAAFKAAGHALPPWRTRTAIHSKWAPAQIAALEVKIAELARQHDTAGDGGCQGAGVVQVPHAASLSMGERPAAAQGRAHAAFGSAPAGDHAHAACVAHYMQPAPLQLLSHAAEPSQAGAPPAQQQAAASAGLPPPVPPSPGVHPAPASATLAHQLQQQALRVQLPGQGAAVAAAGLAAAGSASPAAYRLDGVAHALASAAQQMVSSVSPAGWSPSPLPSQPAPSLPLDCAAASSAASSLRFTRKASAEWKQRRAGGKKMKSLLAVALKKSGGGGSAGGGSAGGSSTRLEAQARAEGAAVLRARSIRTTGDEPWARITTVRWGGAYAGVPGPAAAAAAGNGSASGAAGTGVPSLVVARAATPL
jgi:hypothetical protein